MPAGRQTSASNVVDAELASRLPAQRVVLSGGLEVWHKQAARAPWMHEVSSQCPRQSTACSFLTIPPHPAALDRSAPARQPQGPRRREAHLASHRVAQALRLPRPCLQQTSSNVAKLARALRLSVDKARCESVDLLEAQVALDPLSAERTRLASRNASPETSTEMFRCVIKTPSSPRRTSTVRHHHPCPRAQRDG